MIASSWAEAQIAYELAARWLVLTVPSASSQWDKSALGELTIRDLVGHTSRALLTVESYLFKPVGTVEVDSAVEYFRLALDAARDPAAVAQRGRDAGVALGTDSVVQ